MTSTDKNSFYIVHKKALPEVFLKTVEVKELLKKGEAMTIHEAVEKVGMSRSAYYKYKDYVFTFNELSKEKIITVALVLEHIPGTLSEVLITIAKAGGSIVTINQNIPIHDIANVTISIETKNITMSIEDVIEKIEKIKGVKEIRVIARE